MPTDPQLLALALALDRHRIGTARILTCDRRYEVQYTPRWLFLAWSALRCLCPFARSCAGQRSAAAATLTSLSCSPLALPLPYPPGPPACVRCVGCVADPATIVSLVRGVCPVCQDASFPSLPSGCRAPRALSLPPACTFKLVTTWLSILLSPAPSEH
jgi:hypothetical protein